ncbi:LOW QUALITY PROTEIN: hypothetical protein ACHAXT_008799 [Thalassiosira profunda]
MGWMNDVSQDTSDTQSSRSTSPNDTADSERLAHELSEMAPQMDGQKVVYDEGAGGTEVQLAQAQKRVDTVEQRIRERDAQVSSLKEEKAGCLRQIADLKNQLYQLQFEVEETTSDKATAAHEHEARIADARRESLDAKRALDGALQSQADTVAKVSALERENNALTKQLQAREGSKDEELTKLQQQLAELQTEKTALAAQIADEKASETKNRSEVSNLRSMLKARDEAIQSLQGRVEQGQEEMTALEEEMDKLRGEKDKLSKRDDAVAMLRKEKDEMSQALKDMTAKYDDQQSQLTKREEEIEKLKAELKEGELEKEAFFARSESTTQENHDRVTALEMELQTMREKEDELTSSLNETVEELEDLQADVVFKEGKISTLEREIEEASSLLQTRAVEETDAPSSPGRKESGNFARLRAEIKKVTGEMVQLESDHARQISLLKTSKDADVSKLEKELEEVLAKLTAENEKVASLQASLEEAQEAKAKLSGELDKTKEVMDQLDAEEDQELEESKRKEKEAGLNEELQEARQALIALDKERKYTRQEDAEGDAKVKALIQAGEVKLARTVREKDMVISDLKIELSAKKIFADELKEELESLQISRNYGMSIDPEWHEPDTISKLKTQASTLRKEKRMIESELRAKIEARDATIATLVLSASNQEATVVDLKTEVNRLQTLVGRDSEQLKDLDAAQRKEVARLKERTNDLTAELKQTKRQLLSATEELECARTQLAETDARPDNRPRRCSRRRIPTRSKERDAAIANLLQSVQANEGVIVNLRTDVESFKAKLNETKEDNRRLQHESEIFAAQIIDQDEEFEKLSAQLQEKTSQLASLKRDIASSSSDVRNVKNLERQLNELKDERRRNLAKINMLEVDLRDMELRKGEENGFEVDRLKLELKRALEDKADAEEKLNGQIDSLRMLRNHAVEDAKLRERDGQISSLEQELLELKERAAEDDFDDVFLDEKSGPSKKELHLNEEIESLKATQDTNELSELKSKLAQSEQLREELVQDRSLFNSNKDKELDRLRSQLSEAKAAQTARELEQLSLLKKLESENEEIREEFTVRMREKNSKIVALEQTLSAQEQVVGNMSSEMDQLQNGMEKISIQRRAEIEEMQEELMEYTSKATKLDREVIALSMKLDEKTLKHKAEAAKLKDRIAQLESESPLERVVRDSNTEDKRRERKLEEKNDHLKWLNSSLKDENEKAERTRSISTKRRPQRLPPPCRRKVPPTSSTRPKNNDRWRNVALQEQVAVLSQRVIELEEAASTAAARSRRPPASPRPGMQPSLEKWHGRHAAGSALRVSSYGNDANEANKDLLSNSHSDDEGNNRLDTRTASTPPPLPRPIVSPESREKSKKSSSRFSLRKKSSKDKLPSSPRFDDASNSTTNYDF